VGGEFVSIFGGGMVDFLSLAQSTAVDAPDEFVNYKTHYYSNHRALFIVFGLFTPVDIVDSLLKGLPHFLALGPLYFISGALFFAGLVTAAITRNERYHRCYAIIFLAQTTVISFTIFRTLI
jgi:hypothetical protein